jgi:hypothetical protein
MLRGSPIEGKYFSTFQFVSHKDIEVFVTMVGIDEVIREEKEVSASHALKSISGRVYLDGAVTCPLPET